MFLGGVAVFVSIFAATTANAACNLIPGTEKTFDGALGATNRPFAAPGEPLEIRLRPCDTGSTAFLTGFVDPASDYITTIVFKPPGFAQRAVVLSTSCAFFTPAVESACEAQLSGGSATCIPVTSPAELDIVTRDDGERLSVHFPDTDNLLLPNGDDQTYAGAATIAVTKTGDPLPCQLATVACKGQSGLVACIDRFYANDGGCQKQVPLSTFGSFTALPVPNDYQRQCFDSVPPCDPQSPDEFRVAIDAAGNVLAPIDWRGILVQQNQIPVPRLLRATIGPDTLPITLPGTSFVASYTPEGGLLPPIFEPQFDPQAPSGVMTLFGSADAPYTVLRMARRSEQFQECAGGVYDGLPCNEAADCPGACVGGDRNGERCEDDANCTGGGTCGAPGTCGGTVCASGSRSGEVCNSDLNCPGGECGPALFNLAGLASSGIGPVVVQRFSDGICQEDATDTCELIDPCASGPCVGYALQAQNPVPLEGLEQSSDVFAFSLDEGIDGVPRNGDGDTIDTVVTLRDRDTGVSQPLGAPAGCAGISGTPEGRAVVRAHQPPFSFPAVATEGDVVAFLESETGSANCAENADSDANESILRVFRRNPAGGAPDEVTGAFSPALAAEATLAIDDRSLAISNGRAFFHSREDVATDETTARVSVGTAGTEGEFFSELQITGASLSADGRFVTFNSPSNNWTPGDLGYRDIFVRDRDLDENGIYDEAGPGKVLTERVSEPTGGGNSNGGSSDQAISGNGRYVVFGTGALNLGATAPCAYGNDPSVCYTIVLKDRETDELELISVNSAGVQGNGQSRFPNVTPDGRFVVFQSNSTNLVEGDTNTCPGFGYTDPGECTDIFVRDRCLSNDTPVVGCSPNTTRVSIDPSGQQFTQASSWPTISDDGQVIAFQNHSSVVYAHDRRTGVTKAVSVTSQGVLQFGEAPFVSGNGRFVAFNSWTSLLPADTSPAHDVYVRDLLTDTYDLVSVSSTGVVGNDQSFYAQLSTDGRYVSFTSWASNLVLGDTNTCPPQNNPGQCSDYFIHDRLAGVTRRVSLTNTGGEGNAAAIQASISGDGRSVAWLTLADNLLGPGGDTNVYCDGNNDMILEQCADVYVRTLDPGDTAGDTTGDGDVNDTVLYALESSNGDLTSLCPSIAAATVGGTVAFLRPEGAGAAPTLEGAGPGFADCPTGALVTGGISLNGDIDHSDEVVHFWPGTGAVQNLNRAAAAVEISGLCSLGNDPGTACRRTSDCDGGTCAPTLIAALVSEAGQNDTELNGDGDSEDDVVQIHNTADAPTTWSNVGQAADTVEAIGNLVAFLTPEAAQDDKLNGDADKSDRVLQIYDVAAAKLTNPKQAAEEFVLDGDGDTCTEGPAVAFRTSEAAQSSDLNEDDDLEDDVLQVWSKGTGLLSTIRSVRPCFLEACDPRAPYRIVAGKVKFLTFECDEGGTFDQMLGTCAGGADLNGDGDDDDLILQQFDICKRTIDIIGPVDGESGGVDDPLNPEPEQPVVITEAGRCYQGAALLLVPASCTSDDQCPASATCEEEAIVATYREVTRRDVALKPPKPLTIKIGAGDTSIAKTLKVKIVSADPRGGQSTPVRLTAADGDCPPGTVVGLPDLDDDIAGAQDTAMLAGGKTVKAQVSLLIAAAAFATHNAKAPARCRLELSVTIPLEDNEDPTPSNNVAGVELNLIDDNDTPSTSTHESVITSTKPLKLKIGTAGTALKNVKVTVVNADLTEMNHSIDITADDGDCPAGTMGTPVPASVLGGGGAKATVVVPVTATSASFSTPNHKSSSRCTATITATTSVMGNVEPDASNNTTSLIIDVVDKTD